MTWPVKTMNKMTKLKKDEKVRCKCGTVVPARRMLDVKNVKGISGDFRCDGCVSQLMRKKTFSKFDYMVQQGCSQKDLQAQAAIDVGYVIKKLKLGK